MEGIAGVEEISDTKFGRGFAVLSAAEQVELCDYLCDPGKNRATGKASTVFFKRFRDLTAGGYYTTAEGMKALGYLGNMPLATFAGPSPEALRHVGLL